MKSSTTSDIDLYYRAFPPYLREDLDSLLKSYKFECRHPISGTFNIKMNQYSLNIPIRIYIDQSQFINTHTLPSNQFHILSCLMTRHHDGFQRQKYLNHTLKSYKQWTSPFIQREILE